MDEPHEQQGITGKVSVPDKSLAICFGIALLAPYVGSLPDIPFGNWHLLVGGSSAQFNFGFFFAGSLFLFFVNALSIYPVFFTGVALAKHPLAYWLSLAAYLGAAIAGYGFVYRAIAGDGLEVLGILVLAALAATAGAAVGLLLDKLIKNQSIQIWIVRIALTAAIVSSLSWSVIDASTYKDRKLAWLRNVRGMPQISEIDAKYAAPTEENKSQLTCLGYASVDKSVRLFAESDCVGELKGKHFSNGECLKEHGGSYSWDLRWMNQRCP